MLPEKQKSPATRPASRRTWLAVGLLVLASAGLAAFFSGWTREPSPLPEKGAPRGSEPLRLVSLSPGVTDTIDVLGASQQLVGISDYCTDPTDRKLPSTGSALTPNYEKIAELSPDAIITSEVKGEMLAPLEKLATTHRLPWLNLVEWRASVLRLGELLGREEQAARLEQTIASTLDVPSPAVGPRVLLALDYGDSGSSETWFIRENSIHGAVLRAAGGRNAVSDNVTGHPKLSPEQLLSLDPDVIIVLTSSLERTRADVKAHFGKWSPLQAVRDGKVGLLAAPRALDVGPTILKLVPLLEKELHTLERQEAK